MAPEDILRAAVLLAAARRPPPHYGRPKGGYKPDMAPYPRLDGPPARPIIGGGFPIHPIYRNPNPRRKRYS